MTPVSYDEWEPVVGLEIHVQLNTKSKLFSSAANHFGDEPNTNISVVCTGQPGALPVLNKEAVRKAVQFGLAIKAEISLVSTFDRKSYFYPDSPRNFQITQFEHPIITGGKITAFVDGHAKTFHINRAHLEDDAGMLKHFTTFAGVDYNRAGAPLIEIVSEPCIHSGKEASSYASAIRAILLYLDVSDGNMDEGSLRMDANISVRPKGSSELRPRIEIKNMNSFSFLEMAIESEFKRQVALYKKNPDVAPQELILPGTYRWDPEKKEAILMRRKETADDYRYFPEPDLVPITLTQSYIDQIRNTLPELPAERYGRYQTELNLTPYAAALLINDKPLCDYFERTLTLYSDPRKLCNWVSVEFPGRLKESGQTLDSIGIPPAHVAKLLQMIDTGLITGRIAKQVADDMVASPGLDPETIVKQNPDYSAVNNASEIEPLVDQVLKDNPSSIADYKAGREKALAFLVGQVMKLSKGKASPAIVNELILKKIGAM
ncbi:MAG: Asp-tRNA(Asn)/Glu-tRNA(Gln) amidotransferase subunit GatB [Chlamydiales bacterium]|nr:Asp-tRNA(Asn)/Glu-tRNA(Gln) amidotransferase subunit GatB [Chlamydiales bacterium]